MRTIAFLLLGLSFSVHAGSWQEQILQDAKTIYEKEALTEFKKPLYFKIVTSPVVSASAHHEETFISVDVYTGLLQSPKLTPDSLRMIVCHELGHLFGGAPRKNIPPEWDGPVGPDGFSLLSSEGQADYYAGSSCFKRMLKLEKTTLKRNDFSRVGPELERKCKVVAGLRGEALEICYRSALAGLDFLKLTFDFPISCEEHDDSIAPALIRDFYPDRQCRLDTIINAGLCPKETPLSMNPSEASVNSCASTYAIRPACWFPL